MQLNRLIALALLFVCFIAAALGIQRRQAQEAAIDLSALQNTNRDRLELLELEGQISGGSFGPNSALGIRDRALKLLDEERVKGVLLTVNSPGGTVAVSQELYHALLKLREKKPVVVSMLDTAASGGYYIASAANKIYANAGTLTGSIGVILSSYNVQELLNRVGVQPQTFKTGPYKDILSPNRSVSEAERTLLQNLLSDTYGQFVRDVAQARNLPEDKVRALADGRIYTGTQAKANGLVDEIGTLDDATEALRTLAKNKDLPLVKSRPGFQDLFGGLLSQSSSNLGLGPSKVLEQLFGLFLKGQGLVSQPELPLWQSNFPQPLLLPAPLSE
ncbi:signal peptide peptidase SppA [Leptolyngbya sp. FACHB-261]|nr:signal peptide peptidase SppA [Leptolyngbya sp. FACHB-261]